MAPTPAPDDRQPFKVVLTYKPAAERRWHAVIAIGRAGCDPVFEPADVADWPEALDAVLGVHAAATARWAEQPRHRIAQISIGGSKPATGRAPANGEANATPGKAGDRPGAGAPAPRSDEDAKPPAADGHDATTAAPANDGNAKRNAADAPAEPKRIQRKTAPAPSAPPAQTVVAGGVEKLTLF